MAIQSQGKYSAGIDSIKQRTRDSVFTQPDSTKVIIRTKVLTTGDSVLDETYNVLKSDIKNAESIMGLGWCTSDSCKFYERLEDTCNLLKDELAILKKMDPPNASVIKARQERLDYLQQAVPIGYAKFKAQWNGWSIIGWLMTALAISLGAPFWFDILNKIMRLRGSGNKADLSTNTTAPVTVTGGGASTGAPLSVNVNTQSGEEAVG